MVPRADGLTLALPKGRILKQTLPLLRRVGIDLGAVWEGEHDRRLLFDLPPRPFGPGLSPPPGGPGLPGGVRVLLVKPVDVPTYVEYGVADVGVAGADTLGEEARDLYEPLDLGIGACRLVIAEPAARPTPLRRGMALRVATKYPRLTLNHYRSKGIQPEIIPLFGSVELGPITGLSEQIVDLVESGETLRQNNLREVETILYVTSRLIVHPASLKLKQAPITALIAALRDALVTDGSDLPVRPTGSEGTA